jgi:DNA-binding LacI/PurR family transcriptional regulator
MKRASFRNIRSARQVVAERVREMISAQKLGPGDLLPTYEELAKTIGVAYVTVKQGLDELAAEGLVSRVASKGTFVAKELSRTPRPLKNLGVICASSRTSLFARSYLTEIMHGAMLGSPSGTRLHLYSLQEDGLINAAQLGAEHIDGVLLVGMENDDYLRRFMKWGTPGVVVDYCPSDAPLAHVACDNAAAARRVVAHLAALGHRHVAFATVSARQPVRARGAKTTLLVRESSDVRERQEESLRALREQRVLVQELPVPKVLHARLDAASVVDRLVEQPDRPTALLTADFHYAAHLADALQARGLRVPADMSVCAVAGDRDASFHKPVVAHCRFDFLGMGRMAMELLSVRCLQPENTVSQGHRIGFEFVEGETVAKAPQKRK